LTAFALFCALSAIGTCQAGTFIYPDIYSDGACNVNYAWEQTQTGTWYIELQREGGGAIEQGIASENDSYIQAGLSALTWGFNRQAADGSFPGTGDPFHSTSLFVEEVAHCLLALKAYQPVMGGSNYASYVQEFAPKLELSAEWLVNNATDSNLADDAPYTHRRYVVASAFAQVDKLLNTTEFASEADTFAQNGLELQWPDGVNPELGGFDVNYQMVGEQMAQHFIAAAPSDPLVPNLLQMITNGSNWEKTKISQNGGINIVGSTRVGIELNRDGTVKEPVVSMIEDVFFKQSLTSSSRVWSKNYYRLEKPYFPAKTQTFASDGAESANIPYDEGQESTYALADQHYGVEYLENGLDLDLETDVSMGMLIAGWGIDQQLSNGLFGPTPAIPYNNGKFIESLGRMDDALNAFVSQRGVLTSSEISFQAQIQDTIDSAVDAINNPSEVSVSLAEQKGSPSNLWMLAADFAKAGQLESQLPNSGQSASLYASADGFASAAMALQLSNGENPESGFLDYNAQACGILDAIEYVQRSNNPGLVAQVKASVSQATAFEIAAVGLNGAVPTSNGKAPSYYYITDALINAFGLLGGQKVMVTINRIEQNHGLTIPY
jgi:hypothetical protein